MGTKDTPSSLLRELRRARGRSLRATAEDLSVAPSFLSRLERGERRFAPELRDRIATYYGISDDALLLHDGQVPDDVLEILRDHPEELDVIRSKYSVGKGSPE